MAEWKKLMEADPIEWLLEESNPSVRYLTLTKILDKRETNTEVKRAKADIMRIGVVPKILSKIKEKNWNSPGRFYRDKYKGTVWQLIILAEHEADGDNPQIHAACEYIINNSQDPDSFGFSYDQRADGSGGRHNGVIPCLTGNMIWSLLKFGYLGDERVKNGIDWITRYQRFDDGSAKKPTGWPYDRFEMCWGTHSCHMGVIKTLKALSAIPQKQRDIDIKNTIKNACEYILAHNIYKQSHDLGKVSKPGWLKLQFPLMYQTDILEIAGILVELGIKDDRMKDAVDIIAFKQNEMGKWNLEATFNGRFWTSIEKKGTPSKWITYRALRVLKKYYEQ
ncbi:MAG: nitrogen fixation protein NifH [Spirochaetes bacterium]|nr:nitrogen fixation protein NifH [Spirochaetota bacterium]